jgi:predicted membrane chloride channel (bestrophin family)
LNDNVTENIGFMWFNNKKRSYLEHKTNKNDFTRNGIHFVSWWDVIFNISARPSCSRPFLAVTLWGIFITWNTINQKVTFLGLDQGMEEATFEVITFIVSLLIVFRLGESHKRYLDARLQWGGIVINSRDLTRHFFGYCDDIELSTQAAHWIVAFAYACKQSLRFKKEVNEAREWLDPGDLEALNDSLHMPSYCLERITR